jgi:hypothetical protein
VLHGFQLFEFALKASYLGAQLHLSRDGFAELAH